MNAMKAVEVAPIRSLGWLGLNRNENTTRKQFGALCETVMGGMFAGG